MKFYQVIQCGSSAIGEWIFVLTFLMWVYTVFISRWIFGIVNIFWPWNSDDLSDLIKVGGCALIALAFYLEYTPSQQVQISKQGLVKNLKLSSPGLYSYYGELEAACKEQGKIIKDSEKEIERLESEIARRNLQQIIDKAQKNREEYLQRMSIIEAQASAYYFCKLMREQGKAIDDSAMTEEIQQLERGLKEESEQQGNKIK